MTLAVTGGQGVGKTTFCKALACDLQARTSLPVDILPSIGEGLKRQGIPYGSAATSSSVLAIYAAHLERQRLAPSSGIIILDRCAVDALCYVRALGLNSAAEINLLVETSLMMARSIDFIFHLEMSGIFIETAATHETPELRKRVADLFPAALSELGRPYQSMYAASEYAINEALLAIDPIIAP